MLNKKILAASIAVAFSSTAFATVDIEADTGAAVFASELIAPANLNGDGQLEASNTGNILDIDFEAGFTVAQGTSKYVRVTLTNSAFGAVPDITAVSGTFSATLSQGGAVGDTSAIFEITDSGADIASGDVLTLVATQYDISTSAASTVAVALYETAADAVNQVNALSTESGTYASVASGSTGVFTVAGTNTATVASDFLNFDGDSISGVLAAVGQVDISEILDGTTYTPGGVAVVATDLVTDAQDVTFMGNFSYGTWTLEDESTCVDAGGVASIDVNAGINADEDAATVTVASLDAGPYYLCLEVDGTTETILKDTYSAMLDTDELTNDIGTIKYDTTSIEVPYLTTFSGLNQRFYMVNYSNSSVAYTFSFVSEDGVTVTEKAVSGTIPGGEMIAVKSTDIVELAGKTRTSAIIEVEAVDADVAVSTQTVNLATGTTDTVVLN
jgi:hypothetical protein